MSAAAAPERSPERPPRGEGAAPSRASSGAVFAAFLVLSTLWSWPMARVWDPWIPTRHFDLLPAAWLFAAAPATGLDLVYAGSAWPAGESLARADSYVLLGLGHLFGGLVDPVVALRLVAWLGPALGAAAAERVAHEGYGVARPWSLLAGVGWAFSGIAASAVLEGHVYHLLDPWLPLAWWAWQRGLRPGAGLGWGLLAGVAWALALLTSAYFGVLGLLLLGALALASGLRGLRLWPGLAAVGVPVGLWYAHLFTAGGRWSDQGGPDLFLRQGSQTLGQLAGWSPADDLGGHSIGAGLPFVVAFLALAAPLVLRRAAPRAGSAAEAALPPERAWAVPLLTAFAAGAMLLTLGRDAAWSRTELAWSLPLDALAALPGLGFFRFPVRFAWLFGLVGGVLAARVLERLAEPVLTSRGSAAEELANLSASGGGPAAGEPRRGEPGGASAASDAQQGRAEPGGHARSGVAGPWRRRAGLGLLGLAALEAVIAVGLPWRAGRQVAAAPSAYAAVPEGAAVLDLFGAAPNASAGELEAWARALGCFYQARHRRPVLEVCIGTGIRSPREEAQAWLLGALARDLPITEGLAARRVGAVVVHNSFFEPASRAWLHERLVATLGEPLARSDDGGEPIVVYAAR